MVSPTTDWRPVQGVHHLLSFDNWAPACSSPTTTELDEAEENGWFNCLCSISKYMLYTVACVSADLLVSCQ